MSATIPPADGFLRPWQKITLWVVIGAVCGAVLLLFSGKITFVHKKPPEAQPITVQKDLADAPLHYPPSLVVRTAAAAPAYVNPTKQTAGGAIDEDRVLAMNSDISGLGNSRSAAAGAPAVTDENGKPKPGSPDALEASLTPTTMEGSKVSELPNPRWLIEQGRVLPCTQVTRINSTLPGGVSAIIPEDIRGETGDVVLLDKGSKVFGTIQHTLMTGADRLSVLRQNISTPVLYDGQGMPHQFRIAANSPASSELGETGLDGVVDRHLLQKIGGILGFSLAQGAIQAGIQEATKSNSGTTLNLNSIQSGTDQATATLLNAWVTIPDVMTRDQGLRCGIYVVRDLDMRGAYQLRSSYGRSPR